MDIGEINLFSVPFFFGEIRHINPNSSIPKPFIKIYGIPNVLLSPYIIDQ